jgi:hypothetical protein
MKPDDSRLSENKVSDYWIRAKVSGPLLRGLLVVAYRNQTIYRTIGFGYKYRAPCSKAFWQGLSIIKLSDYRIRIKVSDPLLCLSVCGFEDSLNEADGSRLLDNGHQTIGLQD